MKRLPDSIKKQRGTYEKPRSKKIAKVENLNNLPTPPDHLSDNAKEMFLLIAESMKKAGTLTSDTEQLLTDYAFYCAEAKKWQTRCERIDAEIELNPDSTLLRTLSTYSRFARLNSTQVQRIARILRLTPGDRLPEINSEENPFNMIDKFIYRGNK